VVEALQALRGVQCTVAVTTGGGVGRPHTLRKPPPTQAFSGAHTRGICQWGAASAGQPDQNRAYPGAACAGRRGLGVPVSSHRQSAPATAPGKAPSSAPGQQLEGPGPPLHTVAPAHGHRQQGPAGRRRHGPRMKCFHVGHGPAGCRVTESRKLAAACRTSLQGFPPLLDETPPQCSVTLGGVMRPTGTLVPRMRQAPDGGQEGGTQPTDSSVINRRVLLAPALPRDTRKKTMRRT
jgi:hypothetical protein